MSTMPTCDPEKGRGLQAIFEKRCAGSKHQAGALPLSEPDVRPLAAVASHGQLALPDPHWQTIASLLAFSARESQIARLLLDDASETHIADRLSISRHTVHTYIERLYRKLHVHSRRQLILRIFNAHLSCCGSRSN